MLGFVLASLVAIVKPIFVTAPTIIEIIVAIVLVIVGGIIAYKLGDK